MEIIAIAVLMLFPLFASYVVDRCSTKEEDEKRMKERYKSRKVKNIK